jgi:tripartite-type tricarboxylate transporter receptor subunit TctC
MLLARTFAGLLTLAAISLPTTAALADNYPSKPIKLMVPAAAGGGTDVLGRLVGAGLAEELGQQVIVLNKNGASGRIGTADVLSAPADGYTIEVVWSAILTTNEALFKDVKYNAVKDFDFVGPFAGVPNVLVVHPSLKVSKLKELLDLAKSKPNQLNYASSNPGSMSRLSMDLLTDMAGVKILHVPYNADAEVIPAIVGGHVSMTVTNTAVALPMIQEGRLVPIAVMTAKRSPQLPDLPTVAETVPGFETDLWYAVVAKKGMPKEALEKLTDALRKVVTSEKFKTALAQRGADPLWLERPELTAKIVAEREQLGKIIEKAGIGGQ